MALPVAPGSYSPRDQDEIRRILTEGVDGMVRRIYSLEQAPPAASSGRPIGSHNVWINKTSRVANTGMLSMAQQSVSPTIGAANYIVDMIAAARVIKTKLILMMTGGGHGNYTTADAGGVQRFDLAKWKARMDLFNTPAIVAAVNGGMDVVLWADVLDEPQAGSWGGNITRVVIDEMVRYVKAIFGSTLPCWLSTKTDWKHASDGTYAYTDLDGVATQFIEDFEKPSQFGSADNWRNFVHANANLPGEKYRICISLNTGNGGAGFNEASCPIPPTGGNGTNLKRCAMGYGGPTSQLEVFGAVMMSPATAGAGLGQESVALLLWDDNSVSDNPNHMTNYYAVPGVQASMTALRALCDSKPALPLFRKP